MTTHGNNSPILFSFFAGLGFLDLGFESAGCEIAFVNEKHSPFIEAYKYARQQINIRPPEYGYSEEDITNYVDDPKKTRRLKEMLHEAQRDGRPVGLIGGPPCPDFSVGGKNRGRQGQHGQLSEVYAHIICQQSPDFFLFENVKGLWQTKRHRAFYEELKQRLQNAGFVTSERLINAIEYGAPQDRARIILVGFHRRLLKRLGLRQKNKDTVLPDGAFGWLTHATHPEKTAFAHEWPDTWPFAEESTRACPEGVPQELTVEYWFQKNSVDGHPNAPNCFKPKAGLARFCSVDEGDDSKKSFKRLHRWRYSPTACYGNNEVHLHPYRARRISAAEALAIQSLPKEFSLPPEMTLSNMFKGIGNGVPYMAANGLAETMIDFLGGAKCK